jgi:uncharacterized protein
MNATFATRRVASPWIFGLYALAATTFVAGTRLADWYGDAASGRLLGPFLVVFGLVQVVAAMWSFVERDELGTAMLGIWGAFWIGYGALERLAGAANVAAPGGRAPELAFWFIVVAAITWAAAIAVAVTETRALTATLIVLALAATVGAIGDGAGSDGVRILAGWLFALAGVLAWYTSTALLAALTQGRELLPLGAPRVSSAAAPDVPRPAPAARRAS